eukprot:COSAG01_NODE_8215_length_2871_cov_11.806638_1_plen_106_part_10
MSGLKWNIIKEQFRNIDLLGIPEFSHSQGRYKGHELKADEGGRLIVPPSPPKGDPSGTAAIWVWVSRRLKPLIVCVLTGALLLLAIDSIVCLACGSRGGGGRRARA